MEKWFVIKAFNSQNAFGFGTEAEASTYCDLLNANRTISHYYAEPMAEADTAALDSGDDTDGFRLDLAIDALREQNEWRAEEESKLA